MVERALGGLHVMVVKMTDSGLSGRQYVSRSLDHAGSDDTAFLALVGETIVYADHFMFNFLPGF